jgi:hypothetical protein
MWFDVWQESTGKGGQLRYLQSTTSSTRSRIIPIAFMIGSLKIVLMEMFGPVETIRDAELPSLVLYGRQKRNLTSNYVVTDSLFNCTIPDSTIGA